MAISAISFEQEEKIMTALAQELLTHDRQIFTRLPTWENLSEWRKDEYKRQAKPFFNAMYNILRGHDE